MTALDADLVRRKIETISRNVTALQEVDGISLADYAGDLYRKKGLNGCSRRSSRRRSTRTCICSG
jgi:hypothetical protein